MRLLKRLANGHVQLDGPFDEDQIPAYVILSHRWDGEEEVSYQDIVHGSGREKKGFDKIRFCAEQAFRDGHDYFWIDTCCINKELDGEHQKAMNSMFRWYQCAAKCYVYLADVPAHERKSPGQGASDWKQFFMRSQWFTRGWTLQELLAPRVVEFYSQNSTRLGDKTSLEDLVHDVTGIPVAALRGEPLTSFSEKQRFDWMERRRTKFEEDKVYALMGLFDVEIPIHYGEGQANARNRLKEAIATQTEIVRDLRVTHPRNDKERIEQEKGGGWTEVSDWIVDHSDFQRWRDEPGNALMWIRGDPGKGKTMLVCRIIDELGATIPLPRQLCYFFCQATDARINNASAVLRGLLYMLLEQQPSLVSHVQENYRRGGRSIFEDVNSWVVLTKLFSDILGDHRLRSTVFIIDALDECTHKLQDLLAFIANTSHRSPRVKWLVSSRNWPDVEEPLSKAQHMLGLRLELNAEAVSGAVRFYCERKVQELSEAKKYDPTLRQHVLQHLQDNAGDTFLWVALVCKSLHAVAPRNVRPKLRQFPPGLDELYKRMMNELENSDDGAFCKAVLATVALALRPLTLGELTSLVDLDEEVCNTDDVEDIALRSGCFLTVQSAARDEKVVRFVHQSAKDYLVKQAHDLVFLEGEPAEHSRLAQKCISRICEPGILHKDMCQVSQPGARRNAYDSAYIASHLPSQATYACSFWTEHLVEGGQVLYDNGSVHRLLKPHLLHWFETLSWLEQASSAVTHIQRLQARVVKVNASATASIVHY